MRRESFERRLSRRSIELAVVVDGAEVYEPWFRMKRPVRMSAVGRR